MQYAVEGAIEVRPKLGSGIADEAGIDGVQFHRAIAISEGGWPMSLPAEAIRRAYEGKL